MGVGFAVTIRMQQQPAYPFESALACKFAPLVVEVKFLSAMSEQGQSSTQGQVLNSLGTVVLRLWEIAHC